MNGIESAQFDLSEAQFSIDTAIHLLSSIVADGQIPETNDLYALIDRLKGVHESLVNDIDTLEGLETTRNDH